MVTGYIPLLICGTGTTGTTYRNYGSHMNDFVKYDPFGGGFSTLMFNLSVLYDEYKKQRCRWSHTNDDLELVRYLGATFTLYREPNVDFIFSYNRKPPFVESQITGPSLHPGILMNKRRRILVKSYKTKPKGRPYRKIRIKPPTLFTDKWYFQKDLCKLPLLTVSASAANLRFPFSSPQTENICIYFQILHPQYYRNIGILTEKLESNYNALFTQLQNDYQKQPLYPESQSKPTSGLIGTVFNTFRTQEHIVDPSCTTALQKPNAPNLKPTKWNIEFVDSLWGDHVYTKQIVNLMKENATNMYNKRKRETYLGSKYINFKTGMYSPIFLSNERLAPDWPGLYLEVVYNPLLDAGEGNKVWVDWCSKDDTMWNDRPSRLTISDIPLWAAFMGLKDYATKYFHSPGLQKEMRVTIICPYTEPKLFNNNNTDQGFVPYDYNFGKGRMPDGNGYIPLDYRFSWYPCMFHQQNFMNDMVQSGPFAYKGQEKSCTLTCRYSFKFLFGGNPISQQTIKDPCKQPDFPIPGSRDFFGAVQVTNPRLIDEGYFFKAWDFRRGLFGQRAIKRVQQQQTPLTLFTGPPKRPRMEVPALADGDSDIPPTKWHPWAETTQEETCEEEESSSQTQTTPLQLVLRKQLREQRELKCRVQYLVKQLVKTQFHLHAPIIH